VHEVHVTWGTDTPFTVQFVNTVHFEIKDLNSKDSRKIDMDVNNLKLTRNGIAKRVDSEGADLDVIITNVQRKEFELIKPAQSVAQRLQKFEGRGWRRISTKASPASTTRTTRAPNCAYMHNILIMTPSPTSA
jgi:hypothetical protein